MLAAQIPITHSRRMDQMIQIRKPCNLLVVLDRFLDYIVVSLLDGISRLAPARFKTIAFNVWCQVRMDVRHVGPTIAWGR